MSCLITIVYTDRMMANVLFAEVGTMMSEEIVFLCEFLFAHFAMIRS